MATLRSLMACDGADREELVIFSDGAKNDALQKSVERLRREVGHLMESGSMPFASVRLVERAANYGLAKNIIEGVTELFETCEEVIVLEDDLSVERGFIDYMHRALDFYRGKGVWSVAGYTPRVAVPKDYGYDTYFAPRNCSWGWATWRENWKKVDWNVPDVEKFFSDRDSCRSFNKGGTDLTPMLKKWKFGKNNSWSIRFCYYGFLNDMPTVYPVKSYVVNNGADGSGTHVGATNKYKTETVSEGENLNRFLPMGLEAVQSAGILKSFRKTYDISCLRWLINYFTL